MITRSSNARALIPVSPAGCGLRGLGCSGCQGCPYAAPQLRGLGLTLPDVGGMDSKTLLIVAAVVAVVVIFLFMRGRDSVKRGRRKKLMMAQLEYAEKAAHIKRTT